MEYLLLIYENQQRFAQGFDPAELKEYGAFGQQHASSIKGGHALEPTTAAARLVDPSVGSVRKSGGRGAREFRAVLADGSTSPEADCGPARPG